MVILIKKRILNKIKNIFKAKKILNAKQSIVFSYIFLIWLVLKPSISIRSLDYGLIKNIIFYSYEIIPIVSYLILTTNSLIQSKKENLKKEKALFRNLVLLPLFLFLPILFIYYLNLL